GRPPHREPHHVRGRRPCALHAEPRDDPRPDDQLPVLDPRPDQRRAVSGAGRGQLAVPGAGEEVNGAAVPARPARTPRTRQPRPEVRAAGGVIWREATVADGAGVTRPSGEIVLIHRPRYDDWSFPKGKLNRGEAWKRAAIREVREET